MLENKPAYVAYVPEFSLKVDSHNKYGNNNNNLHATSCASVSSSRPRNELVYFKLDRTMWLNAVKSSQLRRIHN